MGWNRNVTVRAQQCDGSALAATLLPSPQEGQENSLTFSDTAVTQHFLPLVK